MGVDIHMNIVKNKEVIAKDIFDGRNSEWFNNLQGGGWNNEYDHLPAEYGFSDQTPDDIKEYYNKDWCYGFNSVNVSEFKKWFEKYHPDLSAGWISTYDKWRMENKGYIPEDLPVYLGKEDNPADMYFIEYENPYDCSRWLNDYLVENNIPDDADIIYCFDC